jgi:prepilin-type N-terminal cleavage/methylation domain-containing protein
VREYRNDNSHGRLPRNRGAFTLVELTVVIAVIGILLATAAPAMVSIIRRARTVNCGHQAAALATSLTAFAADRNGWLPSGPIEDGLLQAGIAGDPDRGSPFQLYDQRRIADDRSDDEGWFALGLIWKNAYLEEGQAFYCPAAARTEGETYEQCWPSSFDAARNPADGKTRIYATYAYRGGLQSQRGTELGPINLFRSGGVQPTLADNPCRRRMWHEGYNVAFSDAHVAFYEFDEPQIERGDLSDLWLSIADADMGLSD